MRRAMTLLILFTCAAMAFSAPPSRGAKAHPIMNAIGLIDYSTKPTFKPGDWVRYHVVGSNNEGDRDDYYVTVLIAGEEKFWGEDCFWIETRTQAAGTTAPMAIVTLMVAPQFARAEQLGISVSGKGEVKSKPTTEMTIGQPVRLPSVTGGAGCPAGWPFTIGILSIGTRMKPA